MTSNEYDMAVKIHLMAILKDYWDSDEIIPRVMALMRKAYDDGWKDCTNSNISNRCDET